MNNPRHQRLPLALFLALTGFGLAPMVRVEAQTAPKPTAPQSSGPTLRLVNLLAFRGEASLHLDGKQIISNIVTSEIVPDLEITTGAHRLVLQSLSTGKPVLDQAFNIPPHANVTLVLTGGPTGMPGEPDAGPINIAVLTPPEPKTSETVPTDGSSKPEPTCRILFLNADGRGPVRFRAAAGNQTATGDLPSGKTELLDPWPIAPLDLKATPIIPNQSLPPSSLNLFTPTKPIAYYCIFFATGSLAPMRALYIAADKGRDLGQEAVDNR